MGLEEREHRGRREAPIEAHAERSQGKGRAQLPNQAPQEPTGPAAGRRVAGPQHGGDGIPLRLVAEGHRGHDRQIAPGVVVAIEEGELLLAAGRVVGRIEVDRDARGLALEPSAMVLDDRVGQPVPHREQLAPPHGILEPRERGPRGPWLPPYIAAQAPERSGETRGKCPEKARSRSGHALVASWSCTGSCGLSMTTSTAEYLHLLQQPESGGDLGAVHSWDDKA